MIDGLPELLKRRNVIGAFSTEVIVQTGVSSTMTYDQIKQQVITTLADRKSTRLRKILSEQFLGDRKPSVALRHFQQLAPHDPRIVKLRFLEMLPENIRLVLTTAANKLELAEIAVMADQLVEQLRHASIQQVGVSATTTTASEPLEVQIASLTA